MSWYLWLVVGAVALAAFAPLFYPERREESFPVPPQGDSRREGRRG